MPDDPTDPTPDADTVDRGDAQPFDDVRSSIERLTVDLGRLADDTVRTDRLAALGTITGLIAHELNNLLTPAVGYGRAGLRRSDDVAFMRKALERCVQAAERASVVASSVLELAATPSGESAGAADVADVVRREIGAFGISADGAPLEVSVPEGLWVTMRPERLERVLQNLVSNAQRAMSGRDGAVRLTGCATGNTVEIAVEDDGPGLPAGAHENVFDAFVSGSRGRGGRGLGLTLCRELVRDAGGTIRAEAASGGGARFVVTLPMTGGPTADRPTAAA